MEPIYMYIIIGIVIASLVMIILICCCCCKKKKNTGQNQDNDRTKSKRETDSESPDFNPDQVEILASGTSPIIVYNVEEKLKMGTNNEEFRRFPIKSHVTSQNRESNLKRAHVDLNNRQNDLHLDPTMSANDIETNMRVLSDPKARFRDLVCSDVRNELNQILRKESSKITNTRGSPGPIHPSQLKEHATSFTRQEARIKDEGNARDVPIIPKPDYGFLPSSPNDGPRSPYKKREFKGPYGAEDLDDMNNPYTIRRGKQNRIAVA